METEDQKTTLRLDAGVHTRLRILALERRTSFGALVNEALRQFLERETGKGRRRRK